MSTDTRRRVRNIVATLVAVACLAAMPVAVAQSVPEDFVIAVTNDRVAEMKRLLAAGADPDMLDRNGEPLLVIAARAGSAGAIDLLLGARERQRDHPLRRLGTDGRGVGRTTGACEEAARERRRGEATGLERVDLRGDRRP